MEIIVFVLGLAIGSFLNVLIDRFHTGESVLWGRSHCDFCKKPLRWFELIPLFSYIAQRGGCLRCHKKLRLQYPLVEFVTAALTTAIFLSVNPGSLLEVITVLRYTLAMYCCIVILVTDLRWQLIPDGAVIGIGLAALVGLIGAPSPAGFIGSAIVSFLFFYFLWWITRGRGMGFGDVKLSAVLGLFFGYPQIVVVLYGAFLTGACVGVILMIAKKVRMKSKIAFGPFLLLGSAISVIWGADLVRFWNSIFLYI